MSRISAYVATGLSIMVAVMVPAPASALCIFDCAERTKQTAYTAIHPTESLPQSKLITLSVKEITKVRSARKVEAKDDSLLEKARVAAENILTSQEFVAQIIATVHLGSDLSNIGLDDIRVEGDDIVIHSPKIEVIAIELDTKNSVIVSANEGVLVDGSMTAEFLQEMFEQHRSHLSTSALGNKTNLDAARSGLRSALEKIIRSKMGRDYSIEFSY